MEFTAAYDAALQFFWDLSSMGDGGRGGNREQLININDISMTREYPVALFLRCLRVALIAFSISIIAVIADSNVRFCSNSCYMLFSITVKPKAV